MNLIDPQGQSPDAPARLGRRRFLVGAGALAGASALATTLSDGVAHAATDVPTGASQFVPLSKAVRLADTRSPSKYDYETAARNRIRLQISGKNGVSSTASAAVRYSLLRPPR